MQIQNGWILSDDGLISVRIKDIQAIEIQHTRTDGEGRTVYSFHVWTSASVGKDEWGYFRLASSWNLQKLHEMACSIREYKL